MAVVTVALASLPAAAQVDQRGLRRDEARGPQLLREEDQPAPELDVELAAPEPGVAPNALSMARDRVRCERLVLESNTVLDEASVRAILAPLEGRAISIDDLQGARLALTRLYVARGYVTSGVVLDDQDVSSGDIRMRAIEGRLGAVEIRGAAPRFNVRAALRPVESLRGAPLNLGALRAALAAVDADPLVGALHAELLPGGEPGESRLLVEFVAAAPYRVGLRIDNHRAPSVGGEEAVVELGHRSVLGRSDALAVRYAATDGLDDLSADYVLPVGARGWSLGASASVNDAMVIEEPFDRIAIESEARRWRLALARDLGDGMTRVAQIALYLDNQRSETTLLGEPFSFAPGVVDGVAEVSALRVLGEWGWRRPADALIARAIVSLGVDAFGATVNDGLPDTEFAALFGQVQYVRRLGEARDDLLVLRAEFQVADRALLPLEKYAIGGAYTVRGYRHNQVVRDNGYALSAEYRYPLRSGAAAEWGLALAAFADYGRGWNADGQAPAPQTLDSMGIGLRWDPDPRWHGELYLAAPLRDFDSAQHDLQDSGIHFQLAWNWP